MKIAHVLPALVKGGAERVAVDLANAAVAEGHDVAMIVAAPADPQLLQDRLDARVDLRFVSPRASRFGKYLRLPAFIRRHADWLAGRDVIHCHLTFGSAFALLLRYLGKRSPGPRPIIVETYHAVGGAIPHWHRRLHRLLLRSRDGVVLMASDPFWDGFGASRRGPAVRLIPNGVAAPLPIDPDESREYRTRAGIPERATVIGNIGRLVRERRPSLLLDCFASLTRLCRDDLHLLLAGEGPERAALEAQAKRLGIAERVHLPGLLPDPRQALGTIDLYLTQNVRTMPGIASLEAAFTGVPIVALQFDEGFEAGDADWIWSSLDPEKVARHAAELLADPPRLQATAEAQQAYVIKHHGVEAMAAAYHDFYREVLARKPAADYGRRGSRATRS